MVYLSGASGFLGSHLKTALEKKGLNVFTVSHDILGKVALKPFDSFYFCSTYGNLASHTEDDKIIKANVSDLIHVLGQVNFSTLNSFVFVSTSSVKRKIQTMYSRTKKAAEEILFAYMEKYNAPICIVRPLSITGVGDQNEHLIPILIEASRTGEEIPFVPDAYHDYIDVSDVVEGILALSLRRVRGVFELGTGISHSNKEVKEIVEKVTGKNINTRIVTNMRSYDSTEWVSTNFRARNYGFMPKKDLTMIIKEMCDK